MPGLVVIGLVAAAVGAAPALASRGVAVDVGRIEITQALTPGGSYRLPTIGVRNPGDETTEYLLVANPVNDPERQAPPSEWFRFSPARLTLKPGESRPVQARIVLPTGANPGRYVALVGAQIVSKGGGAQVGAAAAARTTFTVEPASALQAWWLKLKSLIGDNRPWSWLSPLALVVALAGWQLARRFSFRLERRVT